VFDQQIDRLTEGTGLGRGSLYGTFGDKSALFRKSLQRYAQTYHPLYDQALSGPHPSPSAVVAAYLQVTLNRIADPTVPDGCLLTMSATQFPALDADGQAMVRAMIDGLRAMLKQALLAAGADEQEAAELALCTLAANKSLAVLSRTGFSSEDLATAAARIPGRPHPLRPRPSTRASSSIRPTALTALWCGRKRLDIGHNAIVARDGQAGGAVVCLPVRAPPPRGCPRSVDSMFASFGATCSGGASAGSDGVRCH
jgi:AcrR family transcriptional regulator